jgi:hypothetical protein
VDQVNDSGAFVKKTCHGWMRMGKTVAREKTGHLFRDCLARAKSKTGGNKLTANYTNWIEAQNAIFSSLKLRLCDTAGFDEAIDDSLDEPVLPELVCSNDEEALSDLLPQEDISPLSIDCKLPAMVNSALLDSLLYFAEI